MTSMTGRQGMASPTGLNPTSTTTGSMREKIPSGYKKGSLQQFTPEAMQLYQQMFGHVGPESYLARLAGGDQSMFEEIEAPAHRQFNEQLGGIASRFSGMGLGGRRTSGFQNAVTAAGSNFAQDLQAQRQGIQRQAIQDLRGLSMDLLGQRPYQNFLIKKQPKQGTNWGGIGGGALGGVAGFFTGGPLGAVSGALQGYNAGSKAFGHQGLGGDGGDGGFPSMSSGDKDWAYEFGDFFSPGI